MPLLLLVYMQSSIDPFCSAKEEFDMATNEKWALSGSIWYILVLPEIWHQAQSVSLAEVAFLLAVLYSEKLKT